MSVPLLQPVFESLSPVAKVSLKSQLDEILGRKVAVAKVEEIYEVFAEAYQHFVLNRRKAASKKAAKKRNK